MFTFSKDILDSKITKGKGYTGSKPPTVSEKFDLVDSGSDDDSDDDDEEEEEPTDLDPSSFSLAWSPPKEVNPAKARNNMFF